MLYQIPKLEVIYMEVTDVVCLSNNGDHDGDNPGGDKSDASGAWTSIN